MADADMKLDLRQRSEPRQRLGFATGLLRRPLAISLLSLATLMLVWEIFGRGGNPLLTSYPSAVFEAFLRQIETGELPAAFLQSMRSLSIGFLLAALVGVPLGLLIGRYPRAEAALGFYFLALDSTPLVAFIPLYILWFGLGFEVKVMIVFTFAVSPIVINTWMGVKGVPKSLVELGRAFVGSEAFVIRKILLPSALPSIMTGVRLGVGRGIIAVCVAELFTSISGLGGLLLTKSEDYNTAGMFVPALTFMALGVVMTTLIGMLERRIAPWHRATSGSGN